MRLSCSFWLENMDGSSAVTTTMPPRTPTYASVMRGSAATLRPTCFMLHIQGHLLIGGVLKIKFGFSSDPEKVVAYFR
jgi:hypothetical protein